MFSSGLRAFGIAGQLQSGRQAFLAKKYDQALKYFHKVAERNPEYVFVSGNFREGILTYIGRAHYNLGQLADARQSLERVVLADKDDHLARLYLGLTLTRSGDHSNGLREIQGGLSGLHDWIEQANAANPSRAFWDPRREIREEIKKDLTTISGGHVDKEKLLTSAEWLGQRMEDEIDQIRRDKSRQLNNES
jgi:tetratricopeptide (TPR) repeat protein